MWLLFLSPCRLCPRVYAHRKQSPGILKISGRQKYRACIIQTPGRLLALPCSAPLLPNAVCFVHVFLFPFYELLPLPCVTVPELSLVYTVLLWYCCFELHEADGWCLSCCKIFDRKEKAEVMTGLSCLSQWSGRSLFVVQEPSHYYTPVLG